jgi:hypothetical protein
VQTIFLHTVCRLLSMWQAVGDDCALQPLISRLAPDFPQSPAVAPTLGHHATSSTCPLNHPFNHAPAVLHSWTASLGPGYSLRTHHGGVWAPPHSLGRAPRFIP